MFKLYLGRILGSCDQHNDVAALSGPLQLYHHNPRSQIGRVLMAAPDLGSPAPYIPTFYQDTTANHWVGNTVFFSQLFLSCMSIKLNSWYSACNQSLDMNNCTQLRTSPSFLNFLKLLRCTKAQTPLSLWILCL